MDGGAGTFAAVDTNEPAMIPDDAVGHGKPHTGPLPRRLGRVKGVEDTFQVAGVNAPATVLDVKMDKLAGRQSGFNTGKLRPCPGG